jgi:hypothetical protein
MTFALATPRSDPRRPEKPGLSAGECLDDGSPPGTKVVPDAFVHPSDLILDQKVNGNARVRSQMRKVIWSVGRADR